MPTTGLRFKQGWNLDTFRTTARRKTPLRLRFHHRGDKTVGNRVKFRYALHTLRYKRGGGGGRKKKKNTKQKKKKKKKRKGKKFQRTCGVEFGERDLPEFLAQVVDERHHLPALPTVRGHDFFRVFLCFFVFFCVFLYFLCFCFVYFYAYFSCIVGVFLRRDICVLIFILIRSKKTKTKKRFACVHDHRGDKQCRR